MRPPLHGSGYKLDEMARVSCVCRSGCDRDVGDIASGYSMDTNFFNLDEFPGCRIDLLAGGVVLASENNSLGGSIAGGAFAQSSTVFSTGSEHPLPGQALGIRLVNLNIIDPSFPGADLEEDFDMIAPNASPVPEPHPGMPLGMMIASALPRRIRRRQARAVLHVACGT